MVPRGTHLRRSVRSNNLLPENRINALNHCCLLVRKAGPTSSEPCSLNSQHECGACPASRSLVGVALRQLRHPAESQSSGCLPSSFTIRCAKHEHKPHAAGCTRRRLPGPWCISEWPRPGRTPVELIRPERKNRHRRCDRAVPVVRGISCRCGQAASTKSSSRCRPMTPLLTSTVLTTGSETWKWRAAAEMSSSDGTLVLMYADRSSKGQSKACAKAR